MKEEIKEYDFFSLGKPFKTIEELIEYSKKWPNLPVDLDYYRNFLDQRFRECKLNAELNKEFTNRTAFRMLRMNTDWAEKE